MNPSESLPRRIAEQNFSAAAKDAAIFELRARIRAGAIPTLCNKQIKTDLSKIIVGIIQHYNTTLDSRQSSLLNTACILRNKILHCEFSSARQQLDPTGTLARSGGVKQVSGVTPASAGAIVRQLSAGEDVGQQPIAATMTKKHKDIFGWLLETDCAGEFTAASSLLLEAIALLEQLGKDESANA